MSEQKREFSKLSLIGFLLTLVPLILLIVAYHGLPDSDVFAWTIIALLIISPIAGFIISIVGVVTSRRHNRSGMGFGIAGIVISSLTGVIALIIGLIAAVLGLALFSMTTMNDTDKKLPTFYTDGEIVAVRYYYHEDGDYRVEELDEDRIDELVDDLNSMELETGTIFMDYYWGGQFGIEMEYEDGTYVTYDGTRLEVLTRSRLNEDFTSADVLTGKSYYVNVVNEDFWEAMEDYFPSIEENGDQVFSGSF